MREILFRGKTYNDKWVQGLLVQMDDHLTQIRKLGSDGIGYYDYSIVPSTVGQYTGLTDKNGKNIFEGDVIRVKYSIRLPMGFGNSLRIATHDIDYIASVIFDKCRFYSTKANGDVCEIPLDSENIEIIGNINDNPELLEVAK